MILSEIDLNETQKHMLVAYVLLNLARADVFDEWSINMDFINKYSKALFNYSID